ncbi:MAG: nucleoside triphosphate pyrophosphatase [Clostridia bacterium]|nr:nucleoside triphosphate pyrophosphatase [Clostridia bacterium]
MQLILASASPRRQELFKMLKLDFVAIPSNAEEDIAPCEPWDYVCKLAELKAQSVKRGRRGCCVVGCDTVVYLDGEIIGKPRDEGDAYGILSKLSGRTHAVYTGLSVVTDERSITQYDRTDVTFCKLSDEEILRYIATGEPMDAAGAYGMQGVGGVFVEKIDGCSFTVIGLPVPKLYRALLSVGIDAVFPQI